MTVKGSKCRPPRRTRSFGLGDRTTASRLRRRRQWPPPWEGRSPATGNRSVTRSNSGRVQDVQGKRDRGRRICRFPGCAGVRLPGSRRGRDIRAGVREVWKGIRPGFACCRVMGWRVRTHQRIMARGCDSPFHRGKRILRGTSLISATSYGLTPMGRSAYRSPDLNGQKGRRRQWARYTLR